MSWEAAILIGLLVWLPASALLGVFIGRFIEWGTGE